MCPNIKDQNFKPQISEKSKFLAKKQRSKSLAKIKEINFENTDQEFTNDIYNRQIREKQIVDRLLIEEKNKKDRDEFQT